MTGEVIFTMGEATRYSVIRSLLEGKMSNQDEASALRLSVRQIKRVKNVHLQKVLDRLSQKLR